MSTRQASSASTGRWLRGAAFALIAFALAGCGAAAGPASGSPAGPAAGTSKPAATQAASAPAAASQAAAKPSGAAGQTGWEQVLAAGNREGKVVIYGPPGSDPPKALIEGFSKQYPQIKGEYNGIPPGELETKVRNEHAAGIHNADAYVGGPSGLLGEFIDSNGYDPIPDYLAGPNADPSKWLGGKFEYADKAGKFSLVFLSGVSSVMTYNPNMVDASQFKSYKDFLEPKWKEKIAVADPSSPGSGQAWMTFVYSQPSLGKDYIRQLMGQRVVLSRDDRQIVEWASRGEYQLGLGASARQTTEFKSRGIPVALLSANQIQEKGYLSVGLGGIGVLNKPPHPNAMKVYLDWLLSREGQIAAAKLAALPTRRTDVPPNEQGIEQEFLPRAGVQYQLSYNEDILPIQREMRAFFSTVASG